MKSEKIAFLSSALVVLGIFLSISTVQGRESAAQAAKLARQQKVAAATAVDTVISNKKLAFSDEFNGLALDDTKWSTCYDWRRPSETGCTNQGNLEQQWYTPNQTVIADGLLQITAIKQPIDVALQSQVKTFQYQSSMINTGRGSTASSVRWAGTYGYYEARIKVSKGQGVWPAFWLLPINKQWPPEIDIMEFIGGRPNEVLQTVHWQENGKPLESSQAIKGPDYSDTWHTYGVDWEPGRIDWYIDGVKTRSYAGLNVPDQPMEVIINLAIGGILPKDADSSTPFPQGMQVDYVRVYQSSDQVRPSQY